MQKQFILVAAVLAVASVTASVNAETGYAITGSIGGLNLARFDTATPGTFSLNVPLTGAVAGQTVKAIDFRPADSQLYAISTGVGSGTPTVPLTQAQLYTVNTATGALTAVGTGFTLGTTGSGRISMDFNPTVDRIRVVSGDNQNFRVNPNNGALVLQDTGLAYDPSGVPAAFVAGDVPFMGDIAYTNNVVGATSTTLYGYDYNFDNFVTIGGVGGTPSPNGGLVFTVGTNPSAFLTNAASIGFDISGATGIAYLQADTGSQSAIDRLSIVNLATGAETLVGNFPTAILDISIVAPEPASLASLALATTLLRRRR